MHVTMLYAAALATALLSARGASAAHSSTATAFAQEAKADDAPPDVPPDVPPANAPAPPEAKATDSPPPSAAPPAAAPAPAPMVTRPPIAPEAPAGADAADNDAPTLAHTPVTHAPRGKALRIDTNVTDPAGVFQVVLWIRKAGMSDYLPMKFVPDKIAAGQYSVEVPTALMSTNLEYYVEAYDNLGNGPARAGSPERPLPLKIDEPIVVEKPPEKIIVPNRPKGAPPAITHSAIGKTLKGKSVEIAARLKGETGVSNPVVKFRQLGDTDWKTLPMGNMSGADYTATIPASQTSKDIEYYLEASDQYGNGPGRSGGPEVPYLLRAEDEPPPPPKVVDLGGKRRRAVESAPFKANPLRAAGYFVLAASLGSMTFAAGESYGAWQANENYQHTFKYEGRDDASLLKRANEYGNRAKTFAIIGASTLVVAIVMLIVFPDHDDVAPAAGSGGDGAVLFRF